MALVAAWVGRAPIVNADGCSRAGSLQEPPGSVNPPHRKKLTKFSQVKLAPWNFFRHCTSLTPEDLPPLFLPAQDQGLEYFNRRP